jgi:squalene-hopene/tetraprenyl-beta-curcumene cyclase
MDCWPSATSPCDVMPGTANEIEILPELGEFFANTRQTLLNLRGSHGHWEGELASSALSTATAVIALDMWLREGVDPTNQELQRLVRGGLEWLARFQNEDGGWGDTLLSKSNISTTALVWAAFADSESLYADTVRRCEQWLHNSAGSLEPRVLAKAIGDRYGADRTFSVPILTTLALRNRLGPQADAWKLVVQLPFELAAFPHQMFASLRLPVVSYALPALIAIGQVRHRRRPTWNPIARGARNLLRSRTSRVLDSIQPSSGGFLEATPLTSFVVLSLIGAGEVRHPVVARGLDFLRRSVRSNGSWPIDTNLATWVTTLATNALSIAAPADSSLDLHECRQILDWLSGQQLQTEHPYTHAAPGGWAWTDLSGGVPDADDTPGALIALWNLAGPASREAAAAGIGWLLDLQNSDGGMPTFCRGWGVLPFDRSSPDLTAHALRAYATWHDHLAPPLRRRVSNSAGRALQYLKRTQRADGSWSPLWFGNQDAPNDENLTYGTSRVLLALQTGSLSFAANHTARPDVESALAWLLTAQSADGGWGGAPDTTSSIEETALAIDALCATLQLTVEAELSSTRHRVGDDNLWNATCRGLQWLADRTSMGRDFAATPIGFYFAKLWYYEKLYPVIYTMAAVGRAMSLSERIAPARPRNECDSR